MILKHESHSADFFYKTVLGELDVWVEIEPVTSLQNLEFPLFTNEGYRRKGIHSLSTLLEPYRK